MSDRFDPYYKWLGILPEEQPPNHYRLLGVPPLIDDPDVIESAADQRMAHVRTFQSGKHSRESQQLLNELSQARITLLNPESKKAYDAQLLDQMGSAQTSAETGGNVLDSLPDLAQLESGIGPSIYETFPDAALSSAGPAPFGTPLSARTKPPPKWLLPAIVGGGSIVATMVIVVAVVLIGLGGDPNIAGGPNGMAEGTNTIAPATTGRLNERRTRLNEQTQSPATLIANQTPLKPSSPYALRFDPRTYVELADSRAVISRDKPFTVEFWLRCNTDVLMPIVGDRAKRAQHPDLQVDDVGWTLSIFEKNGVKPFVALQNGGLLFAEGQNRKWFHVAISTDGGDLLLYENGKRKESRTDTWPESITNIFIGDGPYNRRPALEGSATYFELAGFRISATHRYPSDFTPPRSLGRDDNDKDTVVLLDFSKPIEDAIEDLSGHNHHGRIFDATWLKLDNASLAPPAG